MRSFQVVAGQSGYPSQYTNLRHDARGGSFLLPHQQLGAFSLGTNPANGKTLTLTINGKSKPALSVVSGPKILKIAGLPWKIPND